MNDFDILGMYAAMDAQRSLRGVSWRHVAADNLTGRVDVRVLVSHHRPRSNL